MTTYYTDLLARNVRAARNAATGNRRGMRLNQADVGERMRALGFESWLGQTVSQVESGKRRVTVDELIGLCVALECPPAALLLPVYQGTADVALPGGQLVQLGRDANAITFLTVLRPDGTPDPNTWLGNTPNLRATAKQPKQSKRKDAKQSKQSERKDD